MSDQPGIGDLNVSITLGGRPATLKYTIGNCLALTDGVGLSGLARACNVQELRGMARIIQIGIGGKYDDHGKDEPPLTIEKIVEGMYETGVHALAIGELDDYVWHIMFHKRKASAGEETKKDSPQAKS